MTDGSRQDEARIALEASEWIVLADDRAMTAAETAAFTAWRADPRHDAAFRRLLETWDRLGTLAPRRTAMQPPVAADEATRSRFRAPSFWGGALAAAAACLALIFFVAPWLTGPAPITTSTAELRLLSLPDGSQVTLGAASTLRIRFSDSERRVSLVAGEAYFEVAKDRGRPFLVDLGPSTIRVVGTKFDVSRTRNGIRVAVTEGHVQLSDTDPAPRSALPRPVQLKAGERAERAIATGAVIVTAGRPGDAALPAGAWREGRLVYSETRLDDIVADLNRYYAPGIRIAPGDVADIRITAGFKVSEIPAFMNGLASIAPVGVERSEAGGYEVVAVTGR